MICAYETDQLDALMDTWLESSISGHPFIAKSYWYESYPIVRDIYIPQSKTWVYRQGKTLAGFISIIDQRFLGALFVASDHVGKGVGSQLLQYVQTHYSMLTLEVYQKNQRAVYFYHRRGFRIVEAAWQSDTQYSTWIMCWNTAS